MKYKVKYDKFHLIFMTILLLLCFVSCLLWLKLNKYGYFGIYFGASIILGYVYYFTSYELRKEYLIIKLGFIPIKIKYKDILNIKENKGNITLKLKNYSLNIYPENKEEFSKNLKSRSGK